jgi:predicted exporter
LWLGAATTVAGFAGLAWTSFPGLREMAVFAGVGVLAAVLATRYWVPVLLPRAPAPGRIQLACAGALSRLLERARARRAWLALVPLAALVVCALGLSSARWVDDIEALNQIDAALKLEDERVRARVARMDAGRFVLALGDDEEVALAVNDRVFTRLGALRDEGALASFHSLHTFVWSRALQQTNVEAVLAAPALAERLNQSFASAGFRPGAFASFAAALEQLGTAPVAPLTVADVLDSPLGPLVRPFRVELSATEAHPRQVGIITFLRGIEPDADLGAALGEIPGAYYFDQRATMRAAYRRYRQRTIEMVLAGLVLVGLLVFARYRRLNLALAAFAPALLSAATTLSVLALVGAQLTIIHLVSLLLVLSMGVDYGVFLAESHGDRRALAATTLSVALACVSTVLAFGLLAMSQHPALRAIGVTVGVGVALSFVLAPTGLLLLSGGARAEVAAGEGPREEVDE